MTIIAIGYYFDQFHKHSGASEIINGIAWTCGALSMKLAASGIFILLLYIMLLTSKKYNISSTICDPHKERFVLSAKNK